MGPLNPTNQAIPTVATPEMELKIDHYTPVDQYKQRIQAAKRDLAEQLLYSFQALDELSEPEFLDIMKVARNGTDASDLLEKFRKYKGI